MNLIVIVDSNWAIGHKGDLLAYIPEDLKHFKEKTVGKTIIMGRKTFESLPGKLKNRQNIVLTSRKIEGVEYYDNIEDCIKNAKNEIFIIGGESLYRQFAPYITTMYISQIAHKFEKADTYFPIELFFKGFKVIEEKLLKDKKYKVKTYKYVKQF